MVECRFMIIFYIISTTLFAAHKKIYKKNKVYKNFMEKWGILLGESRAASP